jgi:uncharacterized lipoprotein YddW (UPF0748 family)
MKYFRILALLSALLLAAGCTDKPDIETETDDDFRFNPSGDRITLRHEVRGDWLTTVGGYDWPAGNYVPAQQIQLLQQMIRNLRDAGCNLVFFQVVSNMDAMYRSDILPWSHVLTGTQGTDPGFDPLAVAVEACRECGLEIHAWINPLRAGGFSMSRCSDHVVFAHPGWIQTYGSNYFLDPALPEVRQHLADIVTELMTRYDLDGIHIDDYFYPDGIRSDEKEWDDAASYSLYGKGVAKDEWRFANIDACVKAMHDATLAAKPTAIFGVSPAGRLENTQKLYADPQRWVAQGTVDYLVPQIYWYHGHRTADFKMVLDSWEPIVKSVPMFTGLAAYRLGETGFETMDEFVRQVSECRQASWVQGHVWFRTAFILRDNFLSVLKRNIYNYGSLMPKIGASDRAVPGRPRVSRNGTRIQWEEVDGADGYAVYRLVRDDHDRSQWTAGLVYKGPHISYEGQVRDNYFVLAYAGKEKSDPSEVIFIPSENL